MKIKLNAKYTSKTSGAVIKVLGVHGDPEDRDTLVRVANVVGANGVDPKTTRVIFQDSVRRKYA